MPDSITLGGGSPTTPTQPVHLDVLIAQITLRLAEITAQPKPSYSVEGHSYSWQQYFDSLVSKRQELMRQRAQEHPFEIVSRG